MTETRNNLAANPSAVLESYLQQRIPGSRLVAQRPPQVPEIELYLINADYPQDGLTHEQAADLMDKPPYWGFCWASGQVLARQILDQPEWVRGRTLLDFGAGSGIVGIAAALAGAKSVLLCDCDPWARRAALLNAQHNDVEITAIASHDDDSATAAAVISIADVFYDRDNLPLLAQFNARFDTVLVADSRLNGAPLPGLTVRGTYHSHTVPDLDESAAFNHVRIYTSNSMNSSDEDNRCND